MHPPRLVSDNFMTFFHLVVFYDDSFSLEDSCIPEFTLVNSEINLFLSLTFEVKGKPHCELALKNKQVGEVIMINRRKQDNVDFVFVQVGLTSDLKELFVESSNIMDLNLVHRIVELLRDHFLLLIEVSITVLPSLNLFEDGLDVVERVLKLFGGLNEHLEVFNDFGCSQSVLFLHKFTEAMSFWHLFRLHTLTTFRR